MPEVVRLITSKFREAKVLDLAEVRVQPSTLWCDHGPSHAMPSAHRHDDIEINMVEDAPLLYLFGGTLVRIEPGTAAVFWAANPHLLIDCTENWSGTVRWLHVPLKVVLGWGLPEVELAALLRGTPMLAPTNAYPGAAEFARWSHDIDEGLHDIALLEIQAAIRRLLHDALPADHEPSSDHGLRHVTAMLQYLTAHSNEPLTTADIAAAAHLHPNYAMTLFREVVGVPMHAYLTQHRIAEAQRLLVTTDRTITQLATAVGFGSQSAFYETFVRLCGQPPGQYRRSHKQAIRETAKKGS